MLFRGSLVVALVALAASSAVAAPLLNVAAPADAADATVRNLIVERDYTGGEVQFNITYQSNRAAHLPKTLIMATGCASSPRRKTPEQFYFSFWRPPPREK